MRYTTSSVLALLIICLVPSCADSPTAPHPPLPEPIPPPSSPENLLRAIQVIYNDRARNVEERVTAYADLFPPAEDDSLPLFVFRYGGTDVGDPPTRWRLAEELDAHRNLFQAQDDRVIASLSLSLEFTPPSDPLIPDPGQEGWKESFVTGGKLQLLYASGPTTRGDVHNTRFRMAPANGRWYLADWYEAPGESTWGQVKARFLSTPLPSPQPRFQVDDWSAWSPDMLTVAYHRNTASAAGPPGVYLIQSDGTNNRLLLEGNWFEPRDLRFSPDGSYLS